MAANSSVGLHRTNELILPSFRPNSDTDLLEILPGNSEDVIHFTDPRKHVPKVRKCYFFFLCSQDRCHWGCITTNWFNLQSLQLPPSPQPGHIWDSEPKSCNKSFLQSPTCCTRNWDTQSYPQLLPWLSDRVGLPMSTFLFCLLKWKKWHRCLS